MQLHTILTSCPVTTSSTQESYSHVNENNIFPRTQITTGWSGTTYLGTQYQGTQLTPQLHTVAHMISYTKVHEQKMLPPPKKTENPYNVQMYMTPNIRAGIFQRMCNLTYPMDS